LRALKNCQERENKEKSMSMEKKERKIWEWENERKKRKREKRSGNKDLRGMNEVKEKKNKVQGRMSRCWETKLSLFFQPCAIRQRGRHRCLVVIIFFWPCTCPPF
jgi:hypothetical protein